MAEIVIVLSLVGLIFIAYKGYPVILFAPFFAVIAAATAYPTNEFLPVYTELFQPRMAAFIRNFFPVFLLGAVFGKVMEATGQAQSIANAIIKVFGVKYAMLAVVLASSVLTYGGVSVFVVVFSIYAFGCQVYKEANIPKRLLPGSIVFGSWTYCMEILPGTPQIQNIIPTRVFGTTTYAAPVLSIIAAIIMFVLGYFMLTYLVKQAHDNNEGYGEHKLNEPAPVDVTKLPPVMLSLLPLLIVLVLNLVLTQWMSGWDPAMFAKKYPGMNLKSVVGMWSLIVALLIALAVSISTGWKVLKPLGLGTVLSAGTLVSLLAILNTASEVGYGGVVASLPGFTTIAKMFMNINEGGSPLFALAISTTTISGVTGSSSGGLSVTLEVLGDHFVNWMKVSGTSPELMHRIAAMASGGMDTLPHNGAVVTLLAYCGLTHKQAYKPIFCVTLLKTFVALLTAALAVAFFGG